MPPGTSYIHQSILLSLPNKVIYALGLGMSMGFEILDDL